jgi:hypothetical protein
MPLSRLAYIGRKTLRQFQGYMWYLNTQERLLSRFFHILFILLLLFHHASLLRHSQNGMLPVSDIEHG